MKEVGDEFKNRFKKVTGPTEKRFKNIKPAELRQFVFEALGKQKAEEKLSDVVSCFGSRQESRGRT